MKRILFTLLTVFLIIISSCETENANEVRCFPKRMSANIVFGGETKNLTADFYYIPETELLDHITWSDKQTHHYDYDENLVLKVVRLKRIDLKVQEELWFRYDGNRITRIDLCVKQLDILYQEPIEGDSTYTGFHLFEYNGNNIQFEKIYISENGKKEKLAIENEYEYDSNGNISKYISNNIAAKSQESATLSYHQSKHPYSQINMVFNGESFVDNILTKTDEVENMEYTYDITLNINQYPQEIIERTNGFPTRITRYTYFCK